MSNLVTGLKYEFRVVAVNRGSRSKPSEPTAPQLGGGRYSVLSFKSQVIDFPGYIEPVTNLTLCHFKLYPL